MKLFDECIKDLENAVKLNDSDPYILYRIGRSYFASGKYKKCMKYFKNSLKHKPFFTYECKIYYYIALAYCRVEKFEKAIYPLTFCVNKNPLKLNYVHERAKAY